MRPLCLVKSHTLDVAARRERSLFTSHTFCSNNSSCILRLNENKHLYPKEGVINVNGLFCYNDHAFIAPGQSYLRKVAHLTSWDLSKLYGAYSIIQI